MCLLDAPSFPSDTDDLIELFVTNDFAAPQEIEKFKETYSSSEGLRFYTRDPFIYSRLNYALRTTNIDHLVPFRFVFQDICNQLRDLMVQEPDDKVFTLYRGQQSNVYEISELYSAYFHQSFITNTTFFSTSTDRDVAVGFLRTAIADPYDFNASFILLKFTVRKQDASNYFPFADISKFSNHPKEKEVLFAPGQIFTINNYSVIHENITNIFVFEMNMNNEVDKGIERVHGQFKKLCGLYANDSLLCLVGLLTEYKRLDEAKKLCSSLIPKNEDQNKKYVCYQNLSQIAMEQNDTDEAKIMHKRMNEIKFGAEQFSTTSNGILIRKTDYDEIQTITSQLMNMNSKLSLEQPLDELLAYTQSDEYDNDFKTAMISQYSVARTLMKSGVYGIAITAFELLLHSIKTNENISFDVLLLPRCHMQLGHCYRLLKSNDQSLKNYELALEQNIQLPTDEHIETLVGLGETLEAMNNYKGALYKYIEVAEIYIHDLTIDRLEEHRDNEEAIQRVLSHFVTMD